ncbi:MAG: hypothetical protein OXU86_07010 [Thaumarchaeota archaeon]|nr:hypothetical protein [Nitrososphaerota archaeon]MDD9826499.1 hypothetical protein [Nitrososphaerota archaeon]
MNKQTKPELVLADPKATMEMLRERAGNNEKALAEAEKWGKNRDERLPILHRFVALLERHDIIRSDMNRVDRDFVVAQCYAIATDHGLDMMGYRYLDSQSGPLAPLLDIDLYAVELDGTDPGGLFPDGREQEFLDRVKDKDHAELGCMARDVVIPEHERLTIA